MQRRLIQDPLIRALVDALPDGIDNAIDVRYLAEQIDMKRERTEAPTRSLIASAIKDYGIPIGSCVRGYYLIDSVEDFMANQKHLRARITGILEREGAVQRGWLARSCSQDAGADWPRDCSHPDWKTEHSPFPENKP